MKFEFKKNNLLNCLFLFSLSVFFTQCDDYDHDDHDHEDHLSFEDLRIQQEKDIKNSKKIHRHQCVHDKGPQRPVWGHFFKDIYDPESELSEVEQVEAYRNSGERNAMRRASWTPLRIKYDYSRLSGSASDVSFIKN